MLQPRAISKVDDRLWYKDAIIYELHVRAFFDSNNDGIGDFKGLVQKLDYLVDLGVTALWLLPFYPSPGRDDGYDIADYTSIHQKYGTMRDFRDFLKAAHQRGLRVITEMVLNHTSDQHDWFQRSRRAPAGSKWRNYYVWSDDPRKYKDARIIFKDFESSNWSWDPVAQSYYWHRFYNHQPDLNFENPEVRARMLELVDFWFALGVDGMRLDAVPYLFEEEGTSCENLPATHDFLKHLRAHVDKRFPGRMLLAEANQWPEDAVLYFGEGNECHMAFHFPLMPRLFMALRLEDRFSIMDILEQTPQIPESCQWATFLRIHDELTLEMVTDEERDYMYKSYASDPRARINLGIRRRLAPLLGGDRRQVELLNALLFSLPGTPVLYYGDEIGMGDNVFLGDRNGVRSPFQWNSDRNAGFSKADPQQLYLPVIIAPEYHFATVNAETQENSPNSLLCWMRQLIELRKFYKPLTRGSLRFFTPDNSKVLSYVRQYEDQSIVVVANLSRKAQCVELDLSEFIGRIPMEVFGRVEFPEIGALPYFVTLGPYSFYWFLLLEQSTKNETRPVLLRTVSTVQAFGQPMEALANEELRWKIEADLPAYLGSMRWFAGKSRSIDSCRIEKINLLEIAKDKSHFALCVVRVNYQEGEPERYLVTLAYGEGEQAARIVAETPSAVISSNISRPGGDHDGIYYDATLEAEFFQELLYYILKRRSSGKHGQLIGSTFVTVKKKWLSDPPRPRYRGFEQSNTSVLFDQEFFLKLYRKLETGTNPEVEMGRYLSQSTEFTMAPELIGTLSLESDAESYSLGILATFVDNEGDAWSFTTDYLTHLVEDVRSEAVPQIDEHIRKADLYARLEMEPPSYILDVASYYLEKARLLGLRVAEMHAALAKEDTQADFSPEDFTPFYQRSLYQSMRNATARTISMLAAASHTLTGNARFLADLLLEHEREVYRTFAAIKNTTIRAKRFRCHGDLHLGQILFTGTDFVILDFEGEPSRSLTERKLKRTPLRDVAGMLRSFDYALHFVDRERTAGTVATSKAWPLLEEWSKWSKSVFFKAYIARAQSYLPADPRQLRILTDVYLLEKVLYEIRYELDNRPDWIEIPLAGALDILQVERGRR